ncbi:hypothetical protein GTQ43_37035 [Nostoc sp. KVJ3]|uniref:hypothetical protein n=1 Tax=Nostoc sp. KVJ3 TaxID=457945 RepID=UPI0022386E11|nr:hypothetical protein [Nostoc sp. KVJ3]MCW5318938.1 hypothetical protein [Nostoc sp. KVJ3]MCW5319042.1 hypothetical protein [Nostoc sp. KVJ3]
MDDDTQELITIQQELERLGDRLRKIFPQTHPQFDDVFEDIGAAGYYMREAGYRLESVLLTVQGDEETEVE